jgi:putative nucleotidyltransferase with HDIG domain
MKHHVRWIIVFEVAAGVGSLALCHAYPGREWLHFLVYTAAVLASSGMKIELPKTNGTMSVNFPFILLGIVQLSPLQAVALAVASVLAQCRFKVIEAFTLVQILFNISNVTVATVLAWLSFSGIRHVHGQLAPALAIAAAVYFFANTVPFSLVVSADSGASPVRQWMADFPWYLPFYLVGAMIAAIAHLVGILFGWATSLLLIPMAYTIYRAYTAQREIVRDREQQAKDMEALHLRTIEGLATAIEAKDENTHQHLLRVRVYVAELGKMLNLDDSITRALHTAAFLHDIGKLAVPESIINKPGKLTPEEFGKMKIHPVVGAEILERVRFPYPVVPIVRSHHEAWDGSGYPDGLAGEEIPIGARILSVVDCFDAMASDRPYRKAMPLEDAMAYVKSRAGSSFDPRIVAMLEERYLELEELAREQLEHAKPLDTHIVVERGAAPAAGFAGDESDLRAAGGSFDSMDTEVRGGAGDERSVVAGTVVA